MVLDQGDFGFRGCPGRVESGGPVLGVPTTKRLWTTDVPLHLGTPALLSQPTQDASVLSSIDIRGSSPLIPTVRLVRGASSPSFSLLPDP